MTRSRARGVAFTVALLVVSSTLVGFVGAAGATSENDLSGVSVAFYGSELSLENHYQLVVTDLEERGATVSAVATISEESLDSVDVLWLDDRGTQTYGDDETIVLQRVDEGMALMIHADDYHRSLSNELPGLAVSGGSLCSYSTTTDVEPHPTTDGVDELVGLCAVGHVQTSGPAEPLVRIASGEYTIAAATASDSSRIVWAEEDIGAGMDPRSDNRLFMNQAFDWLAGIIGEPIEEEPVEETPETEDRRPIFRVTDRSIDATTVHVGETVTTTAVVENRGSAAGTYRGVLNDGSATRFADEVRIGAGSSHTFTMPLTFHEAGSYPVRFNDRFVDRVDVEERPPAPLDAADVAVLDATVSRSTVWAGESYAVSAVVENVGTETGVASVAFAAGDDGANSTAVERTVTVTLAPEETAELTHLATVDADAGERVTRTWTANGVPADNVTIVPVAVLETGVVDAFTDPASVAAGGTYDVVAVVHNADDHRRSISVNFAERDGETGSLRFVSIGPGETRTVARTVSAPEDAAGTSLRWWVNELETVVAVGTAD